MTLFTEHVIILSKPTATSCVWLSIKSWIYTDSLVLILVIYHHIIYVYIYDVMINIYRERREIISMYIYLYIYIYTYLGNWMFILILKSGLETENWGCLIILYRNQVLPLQRSDVAREAKSWKLEKEKIGFVWETHKITWKRHRHDIHIPWKLL